MGDLAICSITKQHTSSHGSNPDIISYDDSSCRLRAPQCRRRLETPNDVGLGRTVRTEAVTATSAIFASRILNRATVLPCNSDTTTRHTLCSITLLQADFKQKCISCICSAAGPTTPHSHLHHDCCPVDLRATARSPRHAK